MKKYDIAVLDFETMNEHMNSPCEVAVSLIKDLSIVKVYSSYINPPNNRYNLKNAKIHKIPEDVILKAPKYPDIYQEILYLLKESHLIKSSPDSCVKCYTMFLPFLLIKIDVFS